jgi:3-hydroxybutyryl-CoA dehydrogenase
VGVSINRVGIVGSGIMASGIAEVVAKGGFEVVVVSRSESSAEVCLAKTTKSLARQVEKGKLSAEERDRIAARLTAVTNMAALQFCDLVIESVVEDLAVKKRLFEQLGQVCSESTILATNTSTLPVIELAVSVARADRVVGMHFFNPAPAMSLVEIVPALTTSEETVQAAWDFAVACGKEPVKVKDQTGFIVNALLFPYLNAAVRMLEQGVASKEDIDTAMKGGCGFPLGPLQLLDLVGLDTSLAILERLYDERRDPASVPAPLLRRMVTARQLGRKTGSGFYSYASAPSSAVHA